MSDVHRTVLQKLKSRLTAAFGRLVISGVRTLYNGESIRIPMVFRMEYACPWRMMRKEKVMMGIKAKTWSKYHVKVYVYKEIHVTF